MIKHHFKISLSRVEQSVQNLGFKESNARAKNSGRKRQLVAVSKLSPLRGVFFHRSSRIYFIGLTPLRGVTCEHPVPAGQGQCSLGQDLAVVFLGRRRNGVEWLLLLGKWGKREGNRTLGCEVLGVGFGKMTCYGWLGSAINVSLKREKKTYKHCTTVMSGKALRDLNMLPGLERKNENSSKGSLTKPCVENSNENSEEWKRKNSSSLVSTPNNGDETIKPEVEIANTEVEYIESENLNDLDDVDMSLKTLLDGLDSKDWVLVCEALNNVRRLSIFHKEAMLNMLENVIPLIVKSLKNPRSAVCKTAIMTSADIFSAYSDHIIDSLDPLLVQLLLKSSQDKRFVCEAAERALIAMTTWISPITLLPKLQPYLKNKNPRIRAKASMCFCRSVPRLHVSNCVISGMCSDVVAIVPSEGVYASWGVEGVKAYGIDKLIQIAAAQLSDQLPESREAARTLLLELQNVYEKSHEHAPNTVSEQQEMGSWEHFCQSKLSPLSAQAVLRVTNIAREDLVLGS
ncbi:hypothetical protein CK203_067259 [Vitis vinifera]|uniref:TOG domain-containing protein n=1 Tax=Vitis vinifera TaxID=29760 RepID=A0A438EFR7_VITVI|nr:hypothetical protein CK203_067259 [Vitis vinifera]